VALTITLIGTGDRQLEELLHGSDVRLKSIPAVDLLALAQASAPQPDVVVLDIRDTNLLPPTLVTLRRQHPTTGVIIVAARLDPVLMLEAMRAGVNEWVANPVTAADLNAAVKRVSSSHVSAAQGQMFAFVGAKGGVGTTTTAVNVAAALAQSHAKGDHHTLVIDLHLSYGDAAVFLGAEPRFSVVDAMENTHRLDKAFFESLVAQTKSGVQLLASSERAVGNVDMRRTSTLLQFAAAQYRYTVLDVPRSEAAALEALEAVAAIIIVANQELATVRNAGRMAAAFRQRYGKDRVRVIITRYDKQAEISQEDVERVVGSPVKHTVPNDYRSALKAVNKGRPLALDGGGKLGEAFRTIAQDLGGIRVERQDASKATGSGLFGLITGRR
jgi:pilus assembly protein CpaE